MLLELSASHISCSYVQLYYKEISTFQRIGYFLAITSRVFAL